MDTFIGILELVAWIVVVLALAAGTTWLVVKITPDRSKKEEPET